MGIRNRVSSYRGVIIILSGMAIICAFSSIQCAAKSDLSGMVLSGGFFISLMGGLINPSKFTRPVKISFMKSQVEEVYRPVHQLLDRVRTNSSSLNSSISVYRHFEKLLERVGWNLYIVGVCWEKHKLFDIKLSLK